MKNYKYVSWFSFLFFVALSNILSAKEFETKTPKNMAVTLEAANSIFVPIAGGGYGAGLRFEYALSRFISFIVPLEYRFLAMSGFDESNKFRIATIGFGAKLYFSQLFWYQEIMRGFFLEAKAQAGYAHQQAGMPQSLNNKSATFAFGAALGYNHAFDFGLALNASLGMTARAYLSPITSRASLHPVPELALGLGWAF